MNVLMFSTYEWPNHVVNNYDSLSLVDPFFKIILRRKGYRYLPRVYIPCEDMLPKAVNGLRTVSVQRMIRSFGSFSGVMIELKQILNHKNWNIAWLVLVFEKLGWYVIEKIFWKNKKKD